MPYKSDAQRRKFQQLLKEGKISQAVVDDFDKASKGKTLPERIGPKKPKPTGTDKLRAAYHQKYKKHK